ncbi:MAG: fatty acid desaturase [Pseudomonadota bacterium]
MADTRLKPAKPLRKTEWPTWGLILLVYGSWLSLILNYHALTPWVFVVAMTVTLTLYSSLCHELIHRHPTASESLNDAFGFIPLGLIFPYRIYKESHLAHHDNTQLTLPGIDPESYFQCPVGWESHSRLTRFLCHINMTLGGRLLLQPGFAALCVLKQAIDELVTKSTPTNRRVMWFGHYIMVAALLGLISGPLDIGIWHYVICAYASQAIIQIRSFYEHRPNECEDGRTVMMHASLPMRLLFLNNNYHLVHHDRPDLAWYEIPAFYRQNQASYDARSEGFSVTGYWRWFRYLVSPVESPVHPVGPEQNFQRPHIP